jgi:hypothetical protein
MADWIGTPTVTLGNTTWTLAAGSTLPTTLGIILNNLTGFRVTDNNGGLSSGSYALNYNLALSGMLLTSVQVDSTVAGVTDSITKNVYNVLGGSLLATATSVNGAPATATITGSPSSIYVAELVTVAGPGSVISFANTYTAVPEPTTMIAGALLLLPFGASTLRVLRKHRTA